jgi:L-alanine-DL-glutamate epimerase-like enolase superfamily enzyme
VYLPMLRGMDPLRIEPIWAKLDGVSGWSPARVLLDIALTDLAARSAGQPMWKFLGGWSNQVEVCGFNARGSAHERLEVIAREIDRFGFRAYKIKIGANEDADIAFLKMLRSEYPRMRIRVDANSGYSLDAALRVASHLADLGVDDFEDPCGLKGRNVRLELRRRSPVPIVFDNIIDSVKSAVEVLEEGTQRMALKVSRIGYRRAKAIMAHCRDHGCSVVAGSMTESALGALGALHFYGAHHDFAWSPSEESYFATLAEDVFEQPAIVDGVVTLDDRPGLSGDWIPDKLERLSTPLNG